MQSPSKVSRGLSGLLLLGALAVAGCASVTVTPEGILLRPITRSYIRSLRGSLKGRGVMKSMMADRKHERAL